MDAVSLRGRLLADGAPLAGTVVTLPDVVLAEVTARAFDFLWLDLEHGALGVSDIAPLAIAARAGGAACLARLGGVDDPALGPSLDAGVDGVVAPRVEEAAQAARLVERLHHPPRGSRGLAARRASGYGLDATPAAAPLCICQIESAAGLHEAAGIAAVDGVDALVVGCGDLAVSLGASTPVAEAVARVQDAARSAGIASGVAGPDDPDELASLGNGRSALLVLGADVRLYARALDVSTAELRQQPAPRAPNPEEAHVGT